MSGCDPPRGSSKAVGAARSRAITEPIRNRLRLGLVLLSTVVACRPSEPELRVLERDAFSVALPAWKVVIDEGRAGLGRYKVRHRSGKAFAEVSWQGGERATPEDMRFIVRSLFGNTGIQGEIVTEESLADRDRITATVTPKENPVGIVTLVTCKRTGVMVTLSFSGRDADRVERRHEQALASLQCRGGSPEGFAGTRAPTSSLGEEFGAYSEGDDMMLIDASGRSVLVTGVPSYSVIQFIEQPRPLIKAIGNALKVDLEPVGEVATQSGLGQVSQTVMQARDTADDATYSLGLFTCSDSGHGFFVLAWDDGAVSSHADLAALLSQVGCPNSGSPPFDERKTACEVGASAYCP